jgi:hypothetical protein
MIKDPELLKLAVKAIEAEPKRWDQRLWNSTHGSNDGFPVGSGPWVNWAEDDGYQLQGQFQDLENCGTVMCLAGHVTVMAGFRPLAGAHGYGRCVDPATGEVSYIPDKATELLGLSLEQEANLFHSGFNLTLFEFKKLITSVTGVTFE